MEALNFDLNTMLLCPLIISHIWPNLTVDCWLSLCYFWHQDCMCLLFTSHILGIQPELSHMPLVSSCNMLWCHTSRNIELSCCNRQSHVKSLQSRCTNWIWHPADSVSKSIIQSVVYYSVLHTSTIWPCYRFTVWWLKTPGRVHSTSTLQSIFGNDLMV